jgi:hypothetical protein
MTPTLRKAAAKGMAGGCPKAVNQEDALQVGDVSDDGSCLVLLHWRGNA